MRFFDPTAGAIEVDGVDIRRYSENSWRRKVSFVPQENYLFNTTIEENISFGFESCNHDDIIAAARIAHAHEFILAQPEGYSTPVGDNGSRLSGGQKQRIALARAVLRQPEVLVLDEATSHLDSESEFAIREAMKELRKRCTLLVVAHRFSTIVDADCIVVLDQGCIVEQGSHADLMARGGRYFKLYTLQLAKERGRADLDPTGSSADDVTPPVGLRN
jgi:ABC-type multidrug transport system fused ATPase/permease subunit